MKGYDHALAELDAVSRFFALRARARFRDELDDEEQVVALAQGRGRHGQEVWALTDRRLAILRVGLLSSGYRERSLAELHLDHRRGALFAEILAGEDRLRHVHPAAAAFFGETAGGTARSAGR